MIGKRISPSIEHVQVSDGLSGERLTVGLLTHGAGDPNSATIWSGVADAARENDVNLICFPGKSLRSTLEFEAQSNVIYDFVDASTIDGLVIWLAGLTLRVDLDEINIFCQQFLPLPIVTVGALIKGIPGVMVDNYHGMKDVISHILKAHNRHRIVFIRGPEHHQEAEDRYRAYMDVLSDSDIPFDPELVVLGNFKESGGVTAVEELLDHRKTQFDALVAASDNMAIGAMKTLQARGIKIPSDIIVAGLNDEAQSKYITPPLTTGTLHFYAQARQATEMLLALLRGEQVQERVVLPTKLLVRQSCGCPDPGIVQARIEVPDKQRQTSFEIQALYEQVFTETFQSFEYPSASQETEFVRRLIDAFLAEIIGSNTGEFLTVLEEGLRQVSVTGSHVARWNKAISILRQHVLPTISDPEISQQAENLLHQSRVMIGETAQRGHAYKTLLAEHKLRTLGQINQALSITTNLTELADVLTQTLRLLNIPRCYLSLYEKPELPDEWSTMIMAYDESGYVASEPGGQRFPSQQLVPARFLQNSKQFSLVLLPLYFREDQLGFVLLEADPNEDEIYEVLRGQISGALKRTILTQRNVGLFNEAVEARKAAEEANLLKSHFLSMVSHELRTPLSLIVGTIEMMYQEERAGCLPPLPDIYRQDMDCIQASAQHLFRLIGDVLDLASSQAGELRLACEALPLGKVLQEVVLLGESMVREKGLNWRVDIPDRLPKVLVDRTRLRQVILNLISNAVKFTERGEVCLKVSVGQKTVSMMVCDTGMGIPVDEQATIFDEFHRSGRSQERGYGGMGLGLAISRRLIELHGGTIGVHSTGEEEAGSTFFITLPIIEGAHLEDQLVDNRGHTVLLLAECIEHAQKMHDHLIERGFQVETVGVEDEPGWLSQVVMSPPGAVVLDFLPAAERGWELIKLLRQSPTTRDIPVIFYSLSDERSNGSILEMDYLTKPLASADLAQTLENLGLRSGSGPKTILVVEDEPCIQDMHIRMLESELQNCLILKAGNGREALQVMEEKGLDLVLLDLMMPEMDGFEVLEVMRERELTRGVPVIVLTAQILTEQDMKRLQKGVASVLEKGLFSETEVMSQVEATLARNKRLGSETQRIVRQSMAYMNERYAEPISRRELANHLAVSENYLTRCFKQEMGITPTTYLNRCRVMHARSLLDREIASMTEIAQQVGFNDSNYFGRVFRNEVGVTPSAYLRGKRHSDT